MEQDIQSAKTLFISYNGSPLEMHRGGQYADYKGYNVAKETEMIWFQEMIEQYIGQLSIRDWEAVASLSAIAKSCLDNRMVEHTVAFASRNISSADSLVRLRYAECLLEIIRAHKPAISKELLFQSCRVVVEILEGVIAQPLVVDPGHELEQLQLKDKRALNLRAKKNLDTITDLIN